MGAARKYLLYAAGEILLVMIGILLALQVNNWNEWRKDRDKESVILEELLMTIQSNCDIIKEEINDVENRNNATGNIISAFQDKLPYEESMDRDFHLLRNNTLLVLKKSGYEGLKNVGMDIISSDSLRQEV